MRLAIAADHGGFDYKQKLIRELLSMGHEVMDFGTYSSDSVDYPDYIYPLAKAVGAKEFDRGIVMCGTGIGVSIVANKASGVRCALVNSLEVAKITREHNDSNVLAMGQRVLSYEDCLAITKMWLDTPFSEEVRHCLRINKIGEIENER